MNAVVERSDAVTPPQIGQPWPSQGGIYVGSRMIDGQLHHRIIPGGVECDITSTFDGASDAIEQAIKEQGGFNGFIDWSLPDQRDLMLAYINVPELFDKDELYWTSTPYDSDYAWVVDFEHGYVLIDDRCNEFRCRPFRSFIASSL